MDEGMTNWPVLDEACDGVDLVAAFHGTEPLDQGEENYLRDKDLKNKNEHNLWTLDPALLMEVEK